LLPIKFRPGRTGNEVESDDHTSPLDATCKKFEIIAVRAMAAVLRTIARGGTTGWASAPQPLMMEIGSRP